MNKSWSNTALVAYSLLPKIVNELDFGVNSRVNSSFQSRHLKIGLSNEQLIGEIVELIDEKRKMVNLRFIVSTTLEKLEPRERDILTKRMINKQTFIDIAEEEGVTLRTVFRRFAIAQVAFSKQMSKQGFTEKWFESEYGEDKYIRPIFERINDDAYFIAKSM